MGFDARLADASDNVLINAALRSDLLAINHLFLDDGATFCCNFSIFTVNMFFHCNLLHGL